MFDCAQKSAFACNLPDADSHLLRAMGVFRDVMRKETNKKSRQLLLTEMPRPKGG